MKRIFQSLKTKFIFIFIVVIFLFSSVVIFTFWYTEQKLKSVQYTHLQDTGQNISQSVLRWIKQQIKIAKMMSDFTDYSSMNFSQIEKYLKNSEENYSNYERILFVNSAGDIVFDTSNEQKNYRDAVWFREAVEKNKYISDVLWKEKVPMLLIAVSKKKEDKTVGVLSNFIRLNDLTENLIADSSYCFYLVDHSGTIIAHKDNKKLVGEKIKDTDWLQEDKKLANYVNSRGVKFIGARTFMSELRWFVIVEQDKNEFSVSSTYYKLFITMLLLLLFLTGLTYFLFYKTVINPTKKLTDAFNSISNGNFNQRLKVNRKDEIGRLIDAFNKMNKELSSDFSNLESKIANTTEKLLEKDEELKKSRDALVRTENLIALGELSAGIAHEIRTPLTSIKLFIQSLENELPIDDEQKEGFAIIKGEIDRMEETVRSFLDFARITEFKFETVDINQIFSDVVILIKSRVKNKDIVIETNTEKLPPISGDKKQLTQVFLNLFINSIEAMPEGGKIEVSAELDIDEKYIMISFVDTGCGIEANELAYIFEPFFTTKETGTGMGLAIVYSIIEQHDGNIEVKSSPEEGTEFIISLPVVDI